MAELEIRRRYPGPNASLIIPIAAAVGIAIKRLSTDPTQGALADGDGFVGFLTRAVTADGPSLIDQAMAGQLGRLELDAKIGDAVSLEKGDAVEAEGLTHLVASGSTGGIGLGATIGSELSFYDGKFRVAQGGDTAFFNLAAILTPETAGQVRILAEAIR